MHIGHNGLKCLLPLHPYLMISQFRLCQRQYNCLYYIPLTNINRAAKTYLVLATFPDSAHCFPHG